MPAEMGGSVEMVTSLDRTPVGLCQGGMGSVDGAVFMDADEEELMLAVGVIGDGGHWRNGRVVLVVND
ncbi:hypothetical protein RchiOBHm_Chr2g0169461 [Rosa chinensis]|uniref:Uncharacterized protein n=1 Tax=Rosa chinensis TaxID=74649 RepID=A0A2P6S4V5_ROSCH|nr:hypothetical protein RchiOBHm_Chr2g0169461 [Rosa chinensis]